MFGKNFRYFHKTLQSDFQEFALPSRMLQPIILLNRKISLSQTKDNKCMKIMPFRKIKYSL
jgi:hypothetical protein